MKKIIISGISSIACVSLIAQSPVDTIDFSTQLKALVNSAKNSFKAIPLDIKLKGALTARMIRDNNNDLYYHSVFAGKLSIHEADSLINQLTEEIKSALGDGYEYEKKPETYDVQETCFINKNPTSSDEITVTAFRFFPQCNVYIDIFSKKRTRAENANDTSDIASRVKRIIVDKLGVEEAEVVPEASFTNDLGADSLDTVELVMEFEREFNISLPDEECELITTVGQAINYLKWYIK